MRRPTWPFRWSHAWRRSGSAIYWPQPSALVRTEPHESPDGITDTSPGRTLIMQIPHEAILLRIFIGESDRWEHKPLYEAIVLKARELHLAGATVLRGPMGFGKSSRLHTAKILRLSMDLPLVIEIVDSEEKINAFLPVLDPMIGGGLVTMEKVKVIDYRAGNASGGK